MRSPNQVMPIFSDDDCDDAIGRVRFTRVVWPKHGKRVQSNGGAKNYVILMPDADVENSTRGVIEAALIGVSQQTLADESLLKEHIRVELKRFIQKQTGARPVIMPVVVQI